MFSKAYSGNTRLLSALLVLVSTLLVAVLFTPALSAGARDTDSAKVLEFDTMAPVSGPFVGAANPIRGFAGGGLPWVIASGSGELSAGGALEVRVRGLVLDPADPGVIAAGLAGVNPFNQFAVFVSCLTNADPQQGTPVFAGLFPATRTGDMKAETHITLPRPCVAPIVFVTSPATSRTSARWFATTGVGK
jgi:hypothetical protein